MIAKLTPAQWDAVCARRFAGATLAACVQWARVTYGVSITRERVRQHCFLRRKTRTRTQGAS